MIFYILTIKYLNPKIFLEFQEISKSRISIFTDFYSPTKTFLFECFITGICTGDVLTTLSNIYEVAFCENN